MQLHFTAILKINRDPEAVLHQGALKYEFQLLGFARVYLSTASWAHPVPRDVSRRRAIAGSPYVALSKLDFIEVLPTGNVRPLNIDTVNFGYAGANVRYEIGRVHV